MGDVPTVNTSTWRLPKRSHQTPEASYTDDMYRAKGLPVDPDRAPTTGASGLPTVSTEDWVTPSTRARLEEGRSALDPDDFDGQELSESKPRGIGRRSGMPSTWSKSERKGKGRGPSSPSGSSKRWERRGAKKEIEAQMRDEEAETDEFGDDFDEACIGAFPKGKGKKGRGRGMKVGRGSGPIGRRAMEDVDEDFEEAMGCSGKKGKKSYLKKSRSVQEAGVDPLKALMSRPPQDAPSGSVTIPMALLKRVDGWKFETPVERIFAKARRGPIKVADLKKVIRSLHFEIKAMHPSEHQDKAAYTELLTTLKRLVYGNQAESTQSVQRRLAGLTRSEHLEFATGTPYRKMPTSILQETELDSAPGQFYVGLDETEFDVPYDQRALAGLTERTSLPHPMHDTQPVRSRRAHGILDDGVDGGETFVDQVLAESRWFFRDFGDLAIGAKKRPFDEAPGGRAGPWRGSEDEPAETPIVRKGKVKGAVGDEPEEEPEPKDKKQVPPTKRSKAKAPPEEEPEGDEEQEERVEAEGHPGSYLKHGGSKLKALGHHLSHGSAAQRAKAGLHHHLQKFAKKHGIDIHKHFHPHDRPEKMKAPSKKAKAKAPKHFAPTVGPSFKKK